MAKPTNKHAKLQDLGRLIRETLAEALGATVRDRTGEIRKAIADAVPAAVMAGIQETVSAIIRNAMEMITRAAVTGRRSANRA